MRNSITGALGAFAVALLLSVGALAQQASIPYYIVVSSCSTLTLTAGHTSPLYEDVNRNPCLVAPAAGLPTNAATATGQTNTQAAPGSNSTTATGVQGVTGGKPVAVDGSAVTQPISAASLPLPTGASTSANQSTGNSSLATIATNTGAATPAGSNIIGKVGIDQTTPGTTNGVVVNSSALPTGAATSANQSVGTAGSPSSVVNSVQGIGSGTPVGVAGNVASGSSDSGNPVKAGGRYNATAPTLSDGQRGDLQLDSKGNLLSTMRATNVGGADGVANSLTNCLTSASNSSNCGPLQAAPMLYNGTSQDRQRSVPGIDGTGVGVPAMEEGGASFSNITTATTTTVKSGAGTFHKLCINTYAASATITIYNNTTATGTKILTITNPLTLLSEGPNCAIYDAYFSTGLTVVTTGVQDITVVYR